MLERLPVLLERELVLLERLPVLRLVPERLLEQERGPVLRPQERLHLLLRLLHMLFHLL